MDVVFGLLNAVERAVEATGADLTRDAADAVADVVVFVALTLDVAVVLVAGFVKGLNKNQSLLLLASEFIQKEIGSFV